MRTAEGELYEYACHEGNYALEGVLSGARFEESRAREWGTFLARRRPDSALSGARSHWLAESLGDTGAASGAICGSWSPI